MSPIYSCPETTTSALEDLHSSFVKEDLCEAWNGAAEIDSRLRNCTRFSFIGDETWEHLRNRSVPLEASRFWAQVSQLLILITRTSCSAVQRLVEATALAIGQQNEIALALVSRAMIEHCGSLVWLRAKILAPSFDRLRSVVWPAILSTADAPSPQEPDRTLQEDLVRFAFGARATTAGIEEPDAQPDAEAGKGQWEKYLKKIEKIPESIKVTGVMSYVDQLAKHRGYRDFRVNHALLSEFCHPNSSSRTLDFVTLAHGAVSREISHIRGSSFSPGFLEVFDILRQCVSRMCDRLSQDLGSVHGACYPLPEQAEDEGDRIPPPGSRPFAHLFTGCVVWTDPSNVCVDSNRPLGTLSADQQTRALSVAQILATPKGITEQEWIRQLRYSIDIERELRVSEQMAAVFREETDDRPNADASERRVVYEAIEKGVACKSIGELLSNSPHLKSVRGLDRLFLRLEEQRSG